MPAHRACRRAAWQANRTFRLTPGSASAPTRASHPVPAAASIPCSPYATRRSVHSSLRPAALLIPSACCAPVVSVITAPSRPSSHRTVSQATPDTPESTPRPTLRTATRPRRARKRPHAARPPLLIRLQAPGRKRPATCPSSLRSGHAGQIIRPASRIVCLGSTPNPRYHALADARSSASATAVSRWSAATAS